ncbi:MAG: RNA polymerase sigma-70 factor [Saprospiraceae bacterium]|nr:RNA polymerase sigma-70 factor [Saprospiraceae bacterium]
MELLDKNRFKEVFKEYYNPLCNFAIGITSDRKMAQDVVQDVFTKIWAKRNELSINSSPKSYLFQAVKHRAYEILRKRQNESKVDIGMVESSYNAQNEIEEQANKFMLKEHLYKSIRQLPPKCQEIFVMNKVNGLTYNEIADDLGLSVKTVENQIGKAYRKLRILMAGKMSEIN